MTPTAKPHPSVSSQSEVAVARPIPLYGSEPYNTVVLLALPLSEVAVSTTRAALSIIRTCANHRTRRLCELRTRTRRQHSSLSSTPATRHVTSEPAAAQGQPAAERQAATGQVAMSTLAEAQSESRGDKKAQLVVLYDFALFQSGAVAKVMARQAIGYRFSED